MALSGGGIRSATFNLGVLQALARARLLGTFDYLSTVSGGGYIGSWLSAWIHRAGGVGPVEEALGGENEPQPVKHLREFSNFLTPKRGLFGPDTQTWVATYLRNLILNLVILLSVFSAVLLLPYFFVWAFATLPTQAGRTWSLFNLSPFDALVIVLFFVGVTMVSFNLSWTPQREAPWYAQRKAVYWLITAPTCLALWLALAGIERLAAMSWVDVSICFSVAYAALWLYGGVLQWILTPRGWFGRQPRAVSKRDQLSLASRLLIIATAAVAGAVGGCLFKAAAAGAVALTQLGQHYLATAGASSYPVLAMSFGFPLMLACAALTVVLHIGLVGRGFSSSFHLEWWARLGASAFSFAVGWVALFAVALFGPVLVAFIAEDGPEFGTPTNARVREALRESGASLWTVVLQARDPDLTRTEARERAAVVSDVARASGGDSRMVLSRPAIQSTLTKLAVQIRSRYDVTYGRPESLVPPQRLQVQVKRPGARVAAPTWTGR